MRLGDSGLKVDYIISKLRSVYPEMKSTESVVWTKENSKYLARYVHEYLPEMSNMLNAISGGKVLEKLYIRPRRNEDGAVTSYELSPISMYDNQYAPFISEVDGTTTKLGSPIPETYPLMTLAIPLNYAGHGDSAIANRYRLYVQYNESSSYDPDTRLHDYIVYSLVRGNILSEGDMVPDDGTGSGLKAVPIITPASISRTSIDDAYSVTGVSDTFVMNVYDGTTSNLDSYDEGTYLRDTGDIISEEIVIIGDGKNFNVGVTVGTESKSYTNVSEIKIRYQLSTDYIFINEVDEFHVGSNSVSIKITPPAPTSDTSLNYRVSNQIYGIKGEVTIDTYEKVVGGMIVNKGLRMKSVEYERRIIAARIITGNSVNSVEYEEFKDKDGNIIPIGSDTPVASVETKTWNGPIQYHEDKDPDLNPEYSYYDNEGIRTENTCFDHVRSITITSEAGITTKYEFDTKSINVGSQTTDTGYLRVKFTSRRNASYGKDKVKDTFVFDLNNMTSVARSPSIVSNVEFVNDDSDGMTLLIQLPKSVSNFSLVEVSDYASLDSSESIECDYDALNDSMVATTDYLDLILLDRTITKYSDSDDIEYAQDLSQGRHGGYLGVYDSKLQSYIKSVQSDSLGRTKNVTGWVDPDTEYYLELLKLGKRVPEDV